MSWYKADESSELRETLLIDIPVDRLAQHVDPRTFAL